MFYQFAPAYDTWPELRTTHWMRPPRSELSRGRLRPAEGQCSSIRFSASDIARLADDQGLLNDVCINDCALLLSFQYPSSSTIFSTYAITHIHHHNVDGLTRLLSRNSSYATSGRWILPIHHPGHWTLLIADIPTRSLYQFDSQASLDTWKSDTQVCF